MTLAATSDGVTADSRPRILWPSAPPRSMSVMWSVSSRYIVRRSRLRLAIGRTQSHGLIVGRIILERPEPALPPGHRHLPGAAAFLLQPRHVRFQRRQPLF